MKKLLLLLATIIILHQYATAQERSVSGQVKNEQGEPVPFAAVLDKNSKRQVVADANGHFNIRASTQDILSVTSVGYSENNSKVSGNDMTVVLQKSIIDLGNVIVGSRSLRRTAT